MKNGHVVVGGGVTCSVFHAIWTLPIVLIIYLIWFLVSVSWVTLGRRTLLGLQMTLVLAGSQSHISTCTWSYILLIAGLQRVMTSTDLRDAFLARHCMRCVLDGWVWWRPLLNNVWSCFPSRLCPNSVKQDCGCCVPFQGLTNGAVKDSAGILGPSLSVDPVCTCKGL